MKATSSYQVFPAALVCVLKVSSARGGVRKEENPPGRRLCKQEGGNLPLCQSLEAFTAPHTSHLVTTRSNFDLNPDSSSVFVSMALEQEGRVDVGQVGRSLFCSPFSDKLCFIISFLPSPFTKKHFPPSFVLLLKVNDQIARLFFPPGESSSYTSGGRPSYAAPGTGYGAPSQVT